MESNNITELQNASNFHALKKSLISVPMPAMFLLMICILYGLIGALGNGYGEYFIIVAVGALSLAVCIWAFFAETKGVFILAGILFIITGVAVIFFMIINMLATVGGGVLDIVLILTGSFTLMLGVNSLCVNSRFTGLTVRNPGSAMLEKVKTMIQPVAKANPGQGTSVIQITRQTGIENIKMNGKLDAKPVVFSSKNGNSIILSQPEDVLITLKSDKPVRRGLLRAGFNIGGFDFKGMIDQPSYQIYEEWKKQTSKNA